MGYGLRLSLFFFDMLFTVFARLGLEYGAQSMEHSTEKRVDGRDLNILMLSIISPQSWHTLLGTYMNNCD